MKKTQVFDLTLTSVFIAIIMMMSLVQQIGFITILPGVSITLVHIPTLIGIFILKPKNGLLLGITFGLGSMIASYLYGATPFDLAFQNPLVSILPRALFGLAAWGSFQGLQKVSNIKNGKVYLFIIVSIIATLAIIFGTRQIALNAGTTDQNVMTIITVIAAVVSLGFIGLYIYLMRNNKDSELFVSSSFIVSTVLHTVLVLSAVALFSNAFEMAFGAAVPLILGIAASNGLIEALAAALIGTPIYLTLKSIPQLSAKSKKM